MLINHSLSTLTFSSLSCSPNDLQKTKQERLISLTEHPEISGVRMKYFARYFLFLYNIYVYVFFYVSLVEVSNVFVCMYVYDI